MICSIIGGGASVKDIKSFVGYRIGLNYTYKHRETDLNYAQDYCKDFYDAPNFHSLKHHRYKNKVREWELEGLDFNRTEGKLIQSNASIISGINLALQLGFKTIYVLGCENKLTTPSHFYKDLFYDSFTRDMYGVLFKNIYKRLGMVTLKEDERLIFVNSTIDHFENITTEQYNAISKNTY